MLSIFRIQISQHISSIFILHTTDNWLNGFLKYIPTNVLVVVFHYCQLLGNSRTKQCPTSLNPAKLPWLRFTTLTEVFPCFSSVVRQMPGLNSQSRGTDRISSELSFVLCLSLCYAIVFMLFYCYYVVLLLSCSVIICVVLCIDCVYCTTATGC